MVKEKVKLIDIFLPWGESIGLVVYCHLMVLFNIKFQPPFWVGLLLFLPLAGLEFYLSRRYEGRTLLSTRGISFLLVRLLFLFSFYYLWSVTILPIIHEPSTHLAYAWSMIQAPYRLYNIGYILYARPGIFILVLAILFLCYYGFFLRNKKLRFLTSIFLPWLLLFGLFFVFYNNIFGGVSKKKVESQPGVKIFFQYPTADFRTGRIFSWLNTFRYPQALRIDRERQKLYLAFGSTYPDLSDFPNFLEIDLSAEVLTQADIPTRKYPPPSAGYRALKLQRRLFGPKVIRDFSFFPESTEMMWLTHWGSQFKIYGVSKHNFEVFEEIDIGHHRQIRHWEPYDIFYNNKTETVYVANGVNPLLVAYNLKNKKTQIVDLVHPVRYEPLTPTLSPKGRGRKGEGELANGVEKGIARIGSIPNKILFSPALNKLYLLVMTDKENTLIVEFGVSPLEPARIVKIPHGAITIEIDEESKVILAPSALAKKLYEIDLKSFKIIKKIHTPVVLCRKVLIDNSNNLLYCLDYLRGRLFVIDRDNGKIRRRYWVGNKPLGLVKFGDRIFVASTLGIVEVKIKSEIRMTNDE